MTNLTQCNGKECLKGKKNVTYKLIMLDKKYNITEMLFGFCLYITTQQKKNKLKRPTYIVSFMRILLMSLLLYINKCYYRADKEAINT